jgi:hypothetical protein
MKWAPLWLGLLATGCVGLGDLSGTPSGSTLGTGSSSGTSSGATTTGGGQTSDSGTTGSGTTGLVIGRGASDGTTTGGAATYALFPDGETTSLQCPPPDQTCGIPLLEQWLVVVSSEGGPLEQMVFHANGEYADEGFPADFIPQGDPVPCYHHCYTFQCPNLLILTDESGGHRHVVTWQTLDFGTTSYVFGPVDEPQASFDPTAYPGWASNGTPYDCHADCGGTNDAPVDCP